MEGWIFFGRKTGTDQMEQPVQHLPPSVVLMVHLDACSSLLLPFPSDLLSFKAGFIVPNERFLHVLEHNGTKQMM